ncbi:choline transporter, partial [Acinetobacter baumannii]
TNMIAIQEAGTTPRAIHNPRSWKQRIGLLMDNPQSEEGVKQYFEKQVARAFENIQHEFRRRHLVVTISEVEDGRQLRVDQH